MITSKTALFRLLCLVAPLAVAGRFLKGNEDKVSVCHFPLGDLENYHTLQVSPKAAQAHFKHHEYDLEGTCLENCALICDMFAGDVDDDEFICGEPLVLVEDELTGTDLMDLNVDYWEPN